MKDHCGGLPPDAASDMFAAFTQHDADKSGLGLGLSIAQQCVLSNHGLLSVLDVPGTGCVFTISIPRHQQNDDSEVVRTVVVSHAISSQ